MSTTTVPLTRLEYDVLVEAGALDDAPVELLDGRKVEMSPESTLHVAVMELLADLLRPSASEAGMSVRVAHPVALSDLDEPEPDIAVVTARTDRYATGHPDPDDIALLIEVAGSSRVKDLGAKAERYSAAGIEDYWVVDLVDERTVVHREPRAVAASYESIGSVAFGDPIAPLGLPDLRVDVRLPA